MLKKTITQFKALFAALPSFFAAIIPTVKSCPPCPMCIPKYAAVFSLMGLELTDYMHFLTPIMIASMSLTLFLMYRQMAQKNLCKMPLLFASCACLGIIISKYVLNYSNVTHLFTATLIISVVWHQINLNKAKKCCAAH